MFKIETIVKLALCTLLPMGFGAMADTTPATSSTTVTNQSSNDQSISKLIDLQNQKGCFDSSPPNQAVCNKLDAQISLLRSGTGSGADGCSDPSAKFFAAKTEFSQACGAANISTGGNNKVACEEALVKCHCKSEGATIGNVTCDSAAPGEASSDRNMSESDRATAKLYQYCPSQAAANFDEIKKDRDTANDAADKLEADLPTKLDDANKVMSDAQEKIDGIEEKAQDAKAEYGKAKVQASKDLSAAQKAVKDQITALQGQEQQLDEQSSDLDLKVADAGLARDSTVTQIQLNCHASASTQAAKAMGDAADQIRMGRTPIGGQKSMLKRNGTTLDTIFDRAALKIYQKCMVSKPTKDSIKNANAAYDAAVNKANVAKAAALKRKQALDAQIKQLKDPSGSCGQVAASQDGSTNETDMCRTLREADEAQKQQYSEYQGKLAMLQKQETTAGTQAKQNYASKMAAYSQAQTQAKKQRAKADSLERQLKAANEGGGASDKTAYLTANGKFGAFTDSAKNLLTCPGACSDPKNGAACNLAQSYVDFIGEKVDKAPQVASPPTLGETNGGTNGPATPAAPQTAPRATPAPTNGAGATSN